MKQRYSDVRTRRKDVEKVVNSCMRCRSVDPVAEKLTRGELSVAENWMRLACDIIHYGRNKFLTVVGIEYLIIWSGHKLLQSAPKGGQFKTIRIVTKICRGIDLVPVVNILFYSF